jgi:hypothetical protein
MTDTPILFLIFKRPDTSSLVFEAIRKAQPKRLYVAANAPRGHVEGESEKCQEARSILNQIDWECDLHTLVREHYLECEISISTAIDWFFENEEQGIILEDDCLPHPSFFSYCENLLEYYKTEEKVMLISGDNFQNGKLRGDGSYYFSQYSHIWGWASWRRAWKHYDVDMKSFPEFVERNQIATIFNQPSAQRYWFKKLEKTYQKGVNTWDYQWTYAIWKQNGVTILPNVNLISNIGFQTGGTNTNVMDNDMANLPVKEISFPLIHPKDITPDILADEYTFKKLFKKSLLKKLKLLPYVNWSEILFNKR